MPELERRLTAAWERLAEATGVLLPSGRVVNTILARGHNPQPMVESPENRPTTSDAVAWIPAHNWISEVIQKPELCKLRCCISFAYDLSDQSWLNLDDSLP